MIKLFTDTSANLPVSIIREYGIEVVPFSYTVNGKIFRNQTPESLKANLLRILDSETSKKTVNPKKFLYKKGASK